MMLPDEKHGGEVGEGGGCRRSDSPDESEGGFEPLTFWLLKGKDKGVSSGVKERLRSLLWKVFAGTGDGVHLGEDKQWLRWRECWNGAGTCGFDDGCPMERIEAVTPSSHIPDCRV